MADLQVNELLCFMTTQYDKLEKTNLSSILLEFYSREELINAKNILVSICDKNGLSNPIADFKKNRIASNVEQKVVKDLLDIWNIVDVEKDGILNVEFVAQNPHRVPSVNADKYNLQFLISSILKLQEQSTQLQLQSSQQHVWLKKIFPNLSRLCIK